MKRREMIKGLAALGSIILVPNVLAMGNQIKNKPHFVGLGHGGTNIMMHIHNKGIAAKYSCITGSYVSHLTPDIEHIFFETSPDFRVNGIHYKKQIALTPEMKDVFSADDNYYIFTGLGASLGTGLISNLIAYLQEEHKHYTVFCSLPFLNEGRSKREYANLKKAELEEMLNVMILDHQDIAEESVELSINGIFEKADDVWYKFFKSSLKC